MALPVHTAGITIREVSVVERYLCLLAVALPEASLVAVWGIPSDCLCWDRPIVGSHIGGAVIAVDRTALQVRGLVRCSLIWLGFRLGSDLAPPKASLAPP